jgi:hypothetical protein
MHLRSQAPQFFLQQGIPTLIADHHLRVVMECVIETKASAILQFIEGRRGDLHVTLEEGTCRLPDYADSRQVSPHNFLIGV